MHLPLKKHDRYAYEWATVYAQNRLAQARDRLHAHDADSLAEARRKAHECRVCFYLYTPRIGGAAMTMRPCGLCGRDVMYSSTATNCLCAACASDRGLCARCGGDVNGVKRRKVDLEFRLCEANEDS